jgi:PAS domain S-box-containing protein
LSTDPNREGGENVDGSDQRENAVRKAGFEEEFAERLLTEATDAVVTVGPDSTVVYANPSVEDTFGYPPSDLIGQPTATLFRGSGADRFREAIGRHLTGNPDDEWRDVRLATECSDGTTRVSVSLFAHGDGDGSKRVSGIFREITDHSRRARELERENEQLTRLASVLSHDLREPLNNARAKLTLAKETGDEEYLDDALAINSRMADLVDDVLSLTTVDDRVTDADAEVVDLAAVTELARTTVGVQSAEIAVIHPVAVRANPDHLRTVFENLLTNAVRHAGPDVRVRIGTLSDEDGFFVADDGPGIPPEDRERVFEYTYTTSDEGTGLGLAIVREIANAHDWSVNATESGDGGARIEFSGVALADAGDE